MDGGYGLGPGFHAPFVFSGERLLAGLRWSSAERMTLWKRLTWETGKRIPIRPPENGKAWPPLRRCLGETEKEQNGLDSLSLIPSLGGGRLDAAREAHTSTRPSARTMALLIPAPRGPILDRNGEPLAVTSVAYQLALRFQPAPSTMDPLWEQVEGRAGLEKGIQ